MVRPASHLQACVIAVLLFLLAALVHAEPPAQSVHWGSIAFPEHEQSLTLSERSWTGSQNSTSMAGDITTSA